MNDLSSSFDANWVQQRLARITGMHAEADGLEAIFKGDETSLLRLAESEVIQAGFVERGLVVVRAIVGDRESRAMTTDLSDEALTQCTRTAIARARAGSPNPGGVHLPKSQTIRDAPSWAQDQITRQLDGPTKAAWLSEGCRAHKRDGLALAGRFHSGLRTRAVSSTAGVSAYTQGSYVDLALSALERPAGRGASSWWGRSDARIQRTTLEQALNSVRAECHQAMKPVTLKPGPWDVVLAPAAVAELLQWLSSIAFGSKPYDDGMSFVKGREGTRLVAPSISLYDDASMPFEVGVPLPFDAEGQPKQRVALLERGVAQGIVHSSASAQRCHQQSTGHAQLSEAFPEPGSKAEHLHLSPGQASREELIGKVERGIYINRFHYVNGLLDPRRAVMTGLTRDGCFLIEDGKLGPAIDTLRFTDSILEAFERISGPEAIGRNVEPHGGMGLDDCITVAPHLLIRQLQFTSGR